MVTVRYGISFFVVALLLLPLAAETVNPHDCCSEIDGPDQLTCQCQCQVAAALPVAAGAGPVFLPAYVAADDLACSLKSHDQTKIDHPPRTAA